MMKVLLASLVAIIVITAAAWAIFDNIDMSSQDIYSSSHGSVRL
jgi:hypothetical protein